MFVYNLITTIGHIIQGEYSVLDYFTLGEYCVYVGIEPLVYIYIYIYIYIYNYIYTVLSGGSMHKKPDDVTIINTYIII